LAYREKPHKPSIEVVSPETPNLATTAAVAAMELEDDHETTENLKPRGHCA